MDSNHLKAANLAERVYKTPLTTKSHFRKIKGVEYLTCILQC